MKTLFDTLLFDNRTPEKMSEIYSSPIIDHAELIFRWAKGYQISTREIKIVAMIILHHSEYIIENNLTGKALDILTRSGINENSFLQDKLKKYLYQYIMLLFNLKMKNIEQTLSIFNQIENHPLPDQELSTIIDEQKHRFVKVISLIMDSVELLLLGSDFNIYSFRLQKLEFISDGSYFSRDDALTFLKKNDFDHAKEIYNYLRITKYELPSTIMHHARLELMRNNLEQAKLHTTMAWRLQGKSLNYVQKRIIFFIIMLNMLESKPFEIWLSVMRQSMDSNNQLIYWEMEFVLKNCVDRLGKKNYKILKYLLSLISTGITIKQPWLMKFWEKVEPLPFECWPEYN